MEIGVHRLNNKEGNLIIPHFSTYRFTDLCMHLKFHALSHPSQFLCISLAFYYFHTVLYFWKKHFYQYLRSVKTFSGASFPI